MTSAKLGAGAIPTVTAIPVCSRGLPITGASTDTMHSDLVAVLVTVPVHAADTALPSLKWLLRVPLSKNVAISRLPCCGCRESFVSLLLAVLVPSSSICMHSLVRCATCMWSDCACLFSYAHPSTS